MKNKSENSPNENQKLLTSAQKKVNHEAPSHKSQNLLFLKLCRLLCVAGFLFFIYLIVNSQIIEPWRANQVIHQTKVLYHSIITPTATPDSLPLSSSDSSTHLSPASTEVKGSDNIRTLSKFSTLLQRNSDTKGWLNFPETKIDYAVMQRVDDPDYYLSHDFNGKEQKSGCLFLDPLSSVEKDTKNLVIHGHNMKSTDNMFHYLEYMKKDIDYFKKHTVFRFDTIFKTGQWKIFAVFITNGSNEKEPFFNYMQASFRDSSEFMNFVYQLRIRSIYDLDQVDVNEEDQLCLLSTCSYEMNDYRLVIAARRVRDGEDAVMDTTLIKRNKAPLYPNSYYKNYGGEAPELPKTFEEALKLGNIEWYTNNSQ